MVWDTIPPPPPKGTKPRADGTWWSAGYERDNPGACAMARRAIKREREVWPASNFYDQMADCVLWFSVGLAGVAAIAVWASL